MSSSPRLREESPSPTIPTLWPGCGRLRPPWPLLWFRPRHHADLPGSRWLRCTAVQGADNLALLLQLAVPAEGPGGSQDHQPRRTAVHAPWSSLHPSLLPLHRPAEAHPLRARGPSPTRTGRSAQTADVPQVSRSPGLGLRFLRPVLAGEPRGLPRPAPSAQQHLGALAVAVPSAD